MPNGDYTRYLNARGLEGARIGVPRATFVDESRHGGMLREVIAILRKHGAIVVDPVDLPQQPPPVCRDDTGIKGKDENCSIVFKYGMKRDFNAWLASLGPGAPVKTLSQLREWNRAHRDEGAIKYGQTQLDNSDDVDLEADRARYLADRAEGRTRDRRRRHRRRLEARAARRADLSRVGWRGCLRPNPAIRP